MTDKSRIKAVVRSITGGAAVVTLLALVAAETIHPEISMSMENKLLLVGVISALLAVDISINGSQIPVTINSTDQGIEIGWQATGDQNDSEKQANTGGDTNDDRNA